MRDVLAACEGGGGYDAAVTMATGDALGLPLLTTLINARANAPATEAQFAETVELLAERQGTDSPGLYVRFLSFCFTTTVVQLYCPFTTVSLSLS